MIGTAQDLEAMRQVIDGEIFRLTTLRMLPGRRGELDYIDGELAALSRDRRALSIALINREIEASRNPVSFSRWVSGNGALDDVRKRRLVDRTASRLFSNQGG